ncbi:hypothetical protein MJO28_017177, partial [Puccinia striiformis f. sp. tritici]
MSRRTDKLQSFQDADDMPGSDGYFAKVDLASYLQTGTTHVTSGASSTSATLALEKEESPSGKKEVQLTTKTAPNRPMRSGIVSVIIHHINNLGRANLKGASGDREGAQAGIARVIVNDEMIYKTRGKQYTTMPFFEAGTEHFIRDWTETVVRIAVRDSRIRGKRPVVGGVINIDLEQLFEDSSCSQVTRIFALQEGVGYGWAQISVLFESVEMQLPRNLLGWNTATLEITSPIKADLSDEVTAYLKKKGQKLKLKTVEDILDPDTIESSPPCL